MFCELNLKKHFQSISINKKTAGFGSFSFKYLLINVVALLQDHHNSPSNEFRIYQSTFRNMRPKKYLQAAWLWFRLLKVY